jgi:Cephalosporin hydroxylase
MIRKKIKRFIKKNLGKRRVKHDSLWIKNNVGAYLPVFYEVELDEAERTTADGFHDMYYSKFEGERGPIVISWFGYEMYKCPLDLWTYQEIIVGERPDLIVETGTYKGGSALFLATIFDLLGHGEVITIDVDLTHQAPRPQHPRITYLTGSSVDPSVLAEVERRAEGRKVMVILDADHACEHVLAELRAYRRFIPLNGWMIVEDTNINGHPTYPDFGPGPWEAVEAFLSEDDQFIADRTRERFILTMNPRGFLRRIG